MSVEVLCATTAKRNFEKSITTMRDLYVKELRAYDDIDRELKKIREKLTMFKCHRRENTLRTKEDRLYATLQAKNDVLDKLSFNLGQSILLYKELYNEDFNVNKW